jgi:hypothetical protein
MPCFQTQDEHVRTVMEKDDDYALDDGESEEECKARIRKDFDSGVLKIPCLQMDFVQYNLNFVKDLKQAADALGRKSWSITTIGKKVSSPTRPLRRSTRVSKKLRRDVSIYDSDTEVITVEDSSNESDESDESQVVGKENAEKSSSSKQELSKSKKRTRTSGSRSHTDSILVT